LDCLDAAIGIAGIAVIALAPELEPGVEVVVDLAHAGIIAASAGAFAVSAGIGASEIRPKEGASFDNVFGGGIFVTSTLAYAVSPLHYAAPYRDFADGAGFIGATAAVVPCILGAAQ
jgi:hypothetical protein